MPALRRRDVLAALAIGALGSTVAKRRAAATGSGIVAVGHADPPGITLLDQTDGDTLDFVALSHEPAQLLVDLAGRRVLASDYDNGMSLVSLEGGATARYLPLAFMPVHMERAPRRNLLAINGLTEEGMWLADSDRPQAGRRIRGLVEPHNFRFDRAAKRLFVADRGGRGVAVVEVERAVCVGTVGGRIRERTAAEGVPDQLALSRDERTVLLVQDGSDRVAAIPLDGRELRTGPELGGQPVRPRIDRRGRFFLVELAETSELLFLTPSRLQVMTRLSLEDGPALLAWLWFDQILAVAGRGGGRLLLFDLEGMRIARELLLPGGIGGLVAGAAGDRLFVLLDGPPRILAIGLPALEQMDLGALAGPPITAVTAGAVSFCG